MKKTDIVPVWGRVLRGDKPFLSVEITKECPLRCPGCYAYEPGHLQPGVGLLQLADLRGQSLIDGMLAVVRRFRPLHLSIVGGEPLVRYRELDVLLPKLEDMGIEVQLITSAVRPIPLAWAKLSNLHLVVSVDGLPPEHDRRRSPATYERILKHIAGHQVIVHCTVTRQLLARSDYLSDFAGLWSERPEVRKIWFSLFTPQQSAESEERLSAQDRVAAIGQLVRVRNNYSKVDLPDVVLQGYLRPPSSPDACMFAQITTCLSADLSTPVTPCQFGGRPVCAECGCMASAGMAAVGDYKVLGLVTISGIFNLSRRIGKRFGSARPAR